MYPGVFVSPKLKSVSLREAPSHHEKEKLVCTLLRSFFAAIDFI